MFSAVLFDLDGTLLDIDLDSFLRKYFGLLGPVLATLTDAQSGVQATLDAVISGTEAMATDHPGLTNQAVFDLRFSELTGIDLASEPAATTVAKFYAETFPALSPSHGPRPGASEALSAVSAMGLKCALATNPIFPRAAIDERARWAGVDTGRFDLVTSYENMFACKPSPVYYRQIAQQLGVTPQSCLMVGDDPLLDLAAADTGMMTYYVGDSGATADWTGDLFELADLISQQPKPTP